MESSNVKIQKYIFIVWNQLHLQCSRRMDWSMEIREIRGNTGTYGSSAERNTGNKQQHYTSLHVHMDYLKKYSKIVFFSFFQDVHFIN